MTYKWVYDELGGYTVARRTRRGQDYDLWFRFFAKGFKGANIQEALYLVREDVNAIKRRSFINRWVTFPTIVYGYNLLGFPKVLILQDFCIRLAKSLVPLWIVEKYRNYQKNKSLKV